MKQHYFTPAFLLALGSVLLGCNEGKSNLEDSIDPNRGIVLENMDTTINPGDNFFLFVNGGWYSRTEIPAEEGRWGSFNELQEANNTVLLQVLTDASNNTDKYPAGSDEAKAALFYKAGMDSLHIETVGISPITPILNQIDAINNTQDLQNTLASLHSKGLKGLFDFFVDQDLRQSDVITAYLYQGGLGMPDRDYYLMGDKKSLEIKDAYTAYVQKVLELLDWSAEEAQRDASVIIEIETQLAKSSMTKVEQRNIPALYNKMSLAQVDEIAPVFAWEQYFEALGITTLDTVIVAQPTFFKEIDKVVKGRDLKELKTYLKWHVANSMAPYLHHDFVQASFHFYSTVLSGVEKMRPRWKRIISNTNGAMGEALGKLYVAEAFPPEAKESANEMVENIRLAFRDRIAQLDWMSDATKKEALRKLDAFKVKIGYPDKWKEYKELQLGESFAENILNANAFAFQQEIEKIGKPVDPTEWAMTPPTVNAYYHPAMNEIVFPAGILQPPFYDYKADAAVNYGGIGAVIGHELTHGFDDQGRRFDAEGNLNDWWTEEDANRFEARAQRLIDQFNQYEALDSVFLNGKLTLGENIADLGGLSLAYDGLQRYLEEHGRPDKINGYTPEQRFFLSWAQIWRIKQRPETLRQSVLIGPHSPGNFRVLGPLSNLETFYEAFNVTEGDNMWRPDSVRAKIW